jgi:hypothetical protein
MPELDTPSAAGAVREALRVRLLDELGQELLP